MSSLCNPQREKSGRSPMKILKYFDIFSSFSRSGRYDPGIAGFVPESGSPESLGGGRYVASTSGELPPPEIFTMVDDLDVYPSFDRKNNYDRNSNSTKTPLNPRKPRGDNVPLPALLLFPRANASYIVSKLRKNNSLPDMPADQVLNEEHLNAIESILTTSDDDAISDEALKSFELALCWPSDLLGPVLDAFRVAVLKPSVSAHFFDKQGEEWFCRIMDLLDEAQGSGNQIQVSLCRIVANAYGSKVGQELMLNSSLLDLTVRLCGTFKCPVVPAQIGAASAIANCALVLMKRQEEEMIVEVDRRNLVAQALMKGIDEKLGGVENLSKLCEEAQLLLLQAVVTLLWGDSEVIAAAREVGIGPLAARLKELHPDESGKFIGRAIEKMVII